MGVLIAARCDPPKSVRVKSHWRAARRKARKGPAAGTHYFVAENEQGQTCGHRHGSFLAGHRCARSQNRKAGRKEGRRAATYVTEPKTVK